MDKIPSVFHYNQPNAVTSLDPAFARSQSNIWVVDHLYNTLVQIDDSLNIVPDIAKSWKISDDGLEYRFVLKKGVHFHSNNELKIDRSLNAEDVKASFERIIDPDVGSPGSWIFSGRIDSLTPFVAHDDSTFIIRLSKPFLPMLGILTMQYCSILPREAINDWGEELRTKALGTGPFKLALWKENQGLFLHRNERYFVPDRPKMDGVRVSFISERKTAFLELMNGNLDVISGVDASYRSELLTSGGELRKEHQSQLQLVKSPYLNMEYLGINLEKAKGENSLLSNPWIRRAMNYAIDRKLLLRALKNGVGKEAVNGFIPIGLPSYSDKRTGYSYDLSKARAMIDSSKLDLSSAKPVVLHTNKDYMELCLFLSRQWQKLGINVQVELLESSALRELMRNGQSTFFRASWIADYPDGETFLTVFYSGNPAPPNYTRFNDPDFDRLYESSLVSNIHQERMQLYDAMDKLLINRAPVIFLYYDETAIFSQTSIKGLSRNAFNLLKVEDIERVESF